MKQIINLNNLSKLSFGNLEIEEINKTSPMILICPGGGYDHLSTREGQPVADKFKNLGYNVSILKYSVSPFYYPNFIDEIDTAILYLHKHYKFLFLLGFSAGGHLVGIGSTGKYSKLINGTIYCYPVCSLIDYPNEGTSKHFLSNDDTNANRKKYSLENRVTKDTPPSFLWTTKEDEAVPPKNSIQFVEKLKTLNVKSEFVIFDHGKHGLALADKTAIKDGDLSYVNKDVSKWPLLADSFIKKVLHE